MKPESRVDRHPGAVFLAFLRLGLTSFGGPVAHLAFFRDEFVVRRRWIEEAAYADLVALCQFLPGPASSQVGMALGLSRAGYGGALAAWAGFTLPSAILLILFALGLREFGARFPSGVLHGLKIVALAVVTQAVWGMAGNLCRGFSRRLLMLMACGASLLADSAGHQIIVLAIAALAGLFWLDSEEYGVSEPLPLSVSPVAGMLWLTLFAIGLIGLPLAAQFWPGPALARADAFYRVGSLVFGGGHVVLPLLQAEVVSAGWVANDSFLAGYGAAQAVPGPLFTFAAFLGAASITPPDAWLGGVLCLVSIFAPSFLLVAGALPFWSRLRGNAKIRSALSGINAAVVGLLLAALIHPIGSGALKQPQDALLAVIALIALMRWGLRPWLVVLAAATAGWMLGAT